MCRSGTMLTGLLVTLSLTLACEVSRATPAPSNLREWTSHRAAHDGGGVLVAHVHEVGVDAEGRRGVGVAEAAADGAHGHTGGQHAGGGEVTEVVIMPTSA